ncbi:hypothetical protein GJ744_012082 [Endocarpon pusillum]|uniref:Uncharacterized protein n=1 Tax=Endocarpon pusillum TaxID=364733 RepID=A0A8H7E0P1_9EURO|nr:hypothetical protein GJ744_012082 [Endocarpon pusillum]
MERDRLNEEGRIHGASPRNPSNHNRFDLVAKPTGSAEASEAHGRDILFEHYLTATRQ